MMKDEFNAPRVSWLSVLLGSVFIGFMQTFFAVSIAALIFSGKLTPFLGVGVGMMLAGYAVLSLLIAKYSSLTASISSIQEAPAIILVTLINSVIVTHQDMDGEHLFPIVISIIVITTSLTALFFYLLGQFNLGDLIRYTPYPVIAGFLAGTGWIMVQGGIDLVLGGHEYFTLVTLLSDRYLAKWLLAAVFGLTLFIMLKRNKNIFMLPLIVATVIMLFYWVIIVLDIPIYDIRMQGWLLGPIPETNSYYLGFLSMDSSDPMHLLEIVVTVIPAMFLVSSMAFLLNINAIEILTKQDIDLNKSLKVAGIANLFSGLCGSTVGFTSVDMTSLSYSMNIMSRCVGLLTALIAGFTLYFFLPLLSYIPGFIMGGFLIYIGLDFIYEWFYCMRSKLNKIDYVTLILVMFVILISGFMQGVVLGILIALIVFSINFSNVSIIKNSLSGCDLQSNSQRGGIQQQLLIEQGEKIQIIMLTGFVYFGTANKLRVQLMERINSTTLLPLKYIILDWKQVTGIDSSTIYSLQKIYQLSIANSVQLIFTEVDGGIRMTLDNNLITSNSLKFFAKLNHGLYWCENAILAEFKKDNVFIAFEEILQDAGFSFEQTEIVTQYFEKHELPQGYCLIRQGDHADSLYFIESGRLDVFFESDAGKKTHIQRISTGLFVGEIGLILKQPRTASIVTVSPSVVYKISSDNLDRMKKEAIEVYAEFERVLTLLLAKRLFIADARIKRLL